MFLSFSTSTASSTGQNETPAAFAASKMRNILTKNKLAIIPKTLAVGKQRLILQVGRARHHSWEPREIWAIDRTSGKAAHIVLPVSVDEYTDLIYRFDKSGTQLALQINRKGDVFEGSDDDQVLIGFVDLPANKYSPVLTLRTGTSFPLGDEPRFLWIGSQVIFFPWVDITPTGNRNRIWVLSRQRPFATRVYDGDASIAGSFGNAYISPDGFHVVMAQFGVYTGDFWVNPMQNSGLVLVDVKKMSYHNLTAGSTPRHPDVFVSWLNNRSIEYKHWGAAGSYGTIRMNIP